MKYIDADKLKTEIERLYYNEAEKDESILAADAYKNALDAVEKFLDSLRQEQSEMDLEKEIDFFLYGTYTPERFPNTMQVRDEHTGLKVNDWKFWVNNPEYKVEFARHFYALGLKRKEE